MRKFDPQYNWYDNETPEGKEIEAKIRAAGATAIKVKDTLEKGEAKAAEILSDAEDEAEKIRAKAEADAAKKLKAQLEADAAKPHKSK